MTESGGRQGSDETPAPTGDALFDATFNAIPVPIAHLDGSFNFLRVNRAFAAAEGKLPEYYPGRNYFALFPNEGNEAIFRRVRDTCVAHTAAVTPSDRRGLPGRGVDHRDWTLTPVPLDGAVASLVLALHDAGSMHDSEARARGEARLNEAQRIAHVGSWELDLERDQLSWSAEIFRIFELDPNRFAPSYEGFLEAVHPDDRASVHAAHTRSLVQRSPYEITHRLRMPDGRVKWVTGRGESTFDPEGKPRRSIGTVQDVTDRVIAEQCARETAQLLDSIVEHIPNMIFLKHASDLRFALFNKAGEELIGVGRDKMLGRNDYDFFPKEQADFFTGKDRAVLERHDVVDIAEEPIDTVTHGRRILHTKKIALRDDAGNPTYLLGISEDITDRIAAQDALRAAKKRLRDILDSLFGFVGLYTLDGTLIDANRAPLDAAGLSRTDVLGKPFWETYWWNYDARIQARLRDALQRAARGEVVRYETEVRVKDDGRIVIDVTFGPLRDATGAIANIVGFAVDITERKQAEQALNRFKATLDQTLDCVFMFDPETLRFFYVNQGAVDQVGYTREELLNMTPLDIKPRFDAPRFRAMLAPLIAGTESRLLFRTDHRTKAGTEVPVEIALQYVRPAGEPGRFVAIVRDITERVAVENQLRFANERLEERIVERTRELGAERNFISTLLDIAGGLFVVLDRRGHIVRFNRTCENLTGFGFAELRDKPIWDCLIPPEQREAVRAVFERLATTALPSTHENHWLRKDGSRFLVAWSNATLADERGEVSHVVATGIDITDRKRTEDALRAAKEEAERANAAKSEFLARMSHELRTPMNSILGFAQLLEGFTNPPLQGAERESVREILAAGDHLLHLINDVLDLSRVESGQLLVNLVDVGIDVPMRAVWALAQPLADAKFVALIHKIECDPIPVVRADPMRLKQVLLNLVSNAIKFNRESGSVHLHCARHDDGMLTISVTDSGPGLTAQQISRLFVPFERLDADHRAIEGTGIGLALSKRLIEAMNGTIGVDSTPGAGSTFWITVPLA
jgi:PAS domain S-box-containing protein